LGQIYRLDCPEIKTILIIGDLHSYHLHLPTFKAMLKYARVVEDPWLIINGDIFDLEFFMPKNIKYKKWIKREDGIDEFFLPEFKRECKSVNSILDTLQKHFSKIIYIGGNHGNPRVDKFLSVCPFEYRPHFNIENSLHLKEREIDYIKYGDWLDITKNLTITHGSWHSTTACKKHFEASGKNVIFNHVHKYQVMPFITRGVTKYATSLPAMCNLNPDYMKNSETNWVNGFGELNIYKNSHSLNVYLWKGDHMILPRGIRISDD